MTAIGCSPGATPDARLQNRGARPALFGPSPARPAGRGGFGETSG